MLFAAARDTVMHFHYCICCCRLSLTHCIYVHMQVLALYACDESTKRVDPTLAVENSDDEDDDDDFVAESDECDA